MKKYYQRAICLSFLLTQIPAQAIVLDVSVKELDRLRAEVPHVTSSYGIATAVKGDLLVVGARSYDYNPGSGALDQAGAVFVYRKAADACQWDLEIMLTHPEPNPGDWFGASVAVSGNTIVVGAPQDNVSDPFFKGSAFAFSYTVGAGWNAGQQLLPEDTDPSYENYGISVAIDGNTIVVGVGYDNDMGAAAGSAYLFTGLDNVWMQTDKLLPSAGAHQNFGYDVAIEGDTILVGAPHWTDGGTGAAYIFERSGSNWDSSGTALPATDVAAGDFYGWAVDISGDLAVVGAHMDSSVEEGDNSGSIEIFDKSGGSWTSQGKQVASDGEQNDNFGRDVATDGIAVVAGAPSADGPLIDTGAVYVFYQSDSEGWKEDRHFTPANDTEFTNIKSTGFSVDMHDELLAFGAHGTDLFVNPNPIFIAGAAFNYQVKVHPPIFNNDFEVPLPNVCN